MDQNLGGATGPPLMFTGTIVVKCGDNVTGLPSVRFKREQEKINLALNPMNLRGSMGTRARLEGANGAYISSTEYQGTPRSSAIKMKPFNTMLIKRK